MAAYRRRPVVLDAVQWFPGLPCKGVGEFWCDAQGGVIGVLESAGRSVVLTPGDWLLRGSAGEAWCVESKTFALYYEPAPGRHFCGGYE